MWFEQLWRDVCALRDRYRLAVRSGWWEDQVQVEALAALAAWVPRYDSANGTTRRASWRCCTTSTQSTRCCATESIRFTPTATASRSRAI